jgi:hypothetical protein
MRSVPLFIFERRSPAKITEIPPREPASYKIPKDLWAMQADAKNTCREPLFTYPVIPLTAGNLEISLAS